MEGAVGGGDGDSAEERPMVCTCFPGRVLALGRQAPCAWAWGPGSPPYSRELVARGGQAVLRGPPRA